MLVFMFFLRSYLSEVFLQRSHRREIIYYKTMLKLIRCVIIQGVIFNFAIINLCVVYFYFKHETAYDMMSLVLFIIVHQIFPMIQGDDQMRQYQHHLIVYVFYIPLISTTANLYSNARYDNYFKILIMIIITINITPQGFIINFDSLYFYLFFLYFLLIKINCILSKII